MAAFTSLLGFLMALPAMAQPDPQADLIRRRRRTIQKLRLSRHLLDDTGMDAYENPADDPRWARRIDLER